MPYELPSGKPLVPSGKFLARELSSRKLLEHAAQLLLHAVLGVGADDLARNLLDGRAPSRDDR